MSERPWSTIRRIGRPATPAEDTLQLAREDEQFRDYIGRNLYRTRMGPGHRWADLDEAEREAWRDDAMAMMVDHASGEEADPEGPDDPGGPEGEPMPIEDAA